MTIFLSGALIVGGLMVGRVIAAATNEGPRAGGPERACGLSAPNPDLAKRDIPSVARVPGAEIVTVKESGRFLSAGLNVPRSVEDLLILMRKRAEAADYRVLYEDFEGFEAELFVSLGNRPGVFRIISSRCAGITRLFFQLPA